jgi:hypothetical protein
MTEWCMRFAYWISRATDTHSEYVLIFNFPQQQSLSLTVPLHVHFLTYAVLF